MSRWLLMFGDDPGFSAFGTRFPHFSISFWFPILRVTVTVLGVVDLLASVPIVVHVETILETPEGCAGCGARARVKDRDPVALVDLPAFGRAAKLVWRKRRWHCPDPDCPTGSWTEQAPAIAASRLGRRPRSAPRRRRGHRPCGGRGAPSLREARRRSRTQGPD